MSDNENDAQSPSSPPSHGAAPLSRRFESLLAEGRQLACDVLVIGSGYGGSFAALELAAPGRSVWVFERGREYALGEFPETLGELPGHVQFTRGADGRPRGNRDALCDVRIDESCVSVVGCGLGGTSLINAGVVLEPHPDVLSDPRWPAAIRSGPAMLREAFREVERLLGAAPYPSPERFAKYRALQRLARGIPGAVCEPAVIAVASRDGPNPAGVEQRACLDCGNCVTGCNHGAKNTLPMNVIPLAKARGAEFFTGATAVRVRRVAPGAPASGDGARWIVRFRRTAAMKAEDDPGLFERPVEPESFEIRANLVVIAAGTLGSTELLLRSRDAGLALSARLGERFSANGDTLDFGYAQRNPVDAVGEVIPAGGPSADLAAYRPVGPTILGVIRRRPAGGGADALHPGVAIEEASTPTALFPLMGSLLATMALPHAYAQGPAIAWWLPFGDLAGRLPAFLAENTRLDPLAASPGIARHSQILLGMCVDRGDGRVSLDPDGRLRIHLQSDPDDAAGGRVHRFLASAHARGGFDGGWYMRNPLWRALPEGFGQVGARAGGRVITVHPLGGCPMGSDADSGVVDHLGRVFDVSPGAAPGAVHPGLHVLDGAIVPVPLGANPLLTISALALRAAREISAALGTPGAPSVRQVPEGAMPARHRQMPPVPAADMTIAFTEVLHTRQGEQLDLGAWTDVFTPAQIERLRSGDAGLVVKVDVRTRLFAWLADPGLPWEGAAELRLYDFHGHSRQPRATGLLERSRIVARGSATLRLLVAAPAADARERRERARMARRRFASLREADAGLPNTLLRLLRAPQPCVEKPSLSGFLAYLRASGVHAGWRRLEYRLALSAQRDADEARGSAPGGTPAPVLRVEAAKVLAYAPGAKDPWSALLELDASIAHERHGAIAARLQLDALDLVHRRIYRISGAQDTPTAIAGLAGVAAFWLRALTTTHFWSFRGVDYRARGRAAPGAARPLSPLTLPDGARIDPEPVALSVPRGNGTIDLRLSRYRRGALAAQPLLLVHGMAHGGEVFTTPTVRTNLAGYFVDAGYDVWVLDHRLSSSFADLPPPDDLPRQPASIDELGEHDVPCAVRHVYQATGQRVAVFAHCIGAAATSMAILHGRLAPDAPPPGESAPPPGPPDGSMVSALVLHAVHPWVVPSPWNRISASLAALYRDVLDRPCVDPIPPGPCEAGGIDELIDRIASSIPWGDDHEMHVADIDPEGSGTAICNRMTLFYGREWRHGNLDPRTHAALATLVGPAPTDVFRHVFFMAMRHRLTDRHGDNVYLRSDRLKQHWTMPTLFITGADNQVFDPRSAERSFASMTRVFADLGLAGRARQLAVKVVPDVGHMDFLFGTTAADPGGPFHEVDRFLRSPGDYMGPDASHAQVRRAATRRTYDLMPGPRALVGPIFDYVTLPGKEILLRIWYELRPHVTGVVDDIRGDGDTAVHDLGRHFESMGLPHPGRFRFVLCTLPLSGDGRRELRPPPGLVGSSGTPLSGKFEFELHSRTPVRSLVTHGAVGSDAESGPILFRTLADDDTEPPPRKSDDEARQAEVLRTAPDGSHEGRRAEGRYRFRLSIDLDRQRWLPHLRRLLAGPGPWKVSVLVGSCRWPGLPAEQEAIDGLFARMVAQATAPDGDVIDGLWLLGDQIYADAVANLFETTESEERAASRYRDAFTDDRSYEEIHASGAMRRLMSIVPTWMVVDDHELVDDWPGLPEGARPSDTMRRRFAAVCAYQWREPVAADGPRLVAGDVRGFWRAFQVATLPVFAFDTRTERDYRTLGRWHDCRIIGDAQWRAFRAWLAQRAADDDGRPVFLLSGSVFGVPVRGIVDDPDAAILVDDWLGYPASCREIVRALLDSGLRHVVFVGGDYHLSALATLRLVRVGDGRTLTCHSIVASGLNATLPFANLRASDLPAGEVRLPFSDDEIVAYANVEVLSEAHRQFTRLDVRSAHDAHGGSLVVRVFDDAGRRLALREIRFPQAAAGAAAPAGASAGSQPAG